MQKKECDVLKRRRTSSKREGGVIIHFFFELAGTPPRTGKVGLHSETCI